MLLGMSNAEEDAQLAKVHAIKAFEVARGEYQKEMAQAVIYLAKATKGIIAYVAPPEPDDD